MKMYFGHRKTIDHRWISINGLHGNRTRCPRMVGADESTELWRWMVLLGQWLWLSWLSSQFWHQWSAVQIQQLAKFILNLCLLYWTDKNKEKEVALSAIFSLKQIVPTTAAATLQYFLFNMNKQTKTSRTRRNDKFLPKKDSMREQRTHLSPVLKNGPTPASFSFIFFFSNKHENSYNKYMWKNVMSIQYMALGFEPTTFATQVSSHNH